MAQSYRKFEQFQEPVTVTQPFFMWKSTDPSANLPAASPYFSAHPQYQNISCQNSQMTANTALRYTQQPQTQHIQHQYIPPHAPQYGMPQHDNSWQFYMPPVLNKISTLPAKVAKLKPTFWEEFKRIYITEVIAFTMSKATLFTLIFSFMFLGCIFFLSGFFTATNIYRQQHHEVSRTHTPTETAMLQGRPEKMVNMGAGIAYAAPKAYQYQGGVKVDQHMRRPSTHVEKHIATGHPQYR